jgi:hypothetical protein
MKHIDFFSLYKELEHLEYAELFKAVKAHGGKYVFGKGEDVGFDNCPVIAAYTRYSDNVEDFYVDTVSVDENGKVSIYGVAVDYGSSPVKIEPLQGMIGYITDYIPETDEVKNVASFQKITVFFGEEANDIFQKIDFDDESSVREGCERLVKCDCGLKKRTFRTKSELEAYRQGICDCCGWTQYNYIIGKSVEELIKNNNK